MGNQLEWELIRKIKNAKRSDQALSDSTVHMQQEMCGRTGENVRAVRQRWRWHDLSMTWLLFRRWAPHVSQKWNDDVVGC